jgi:hypothetical protein
MSRVSGKLVVQHRSDGAAMGTLDAFFLMRCFGEVSPDDMRATLKCHEVLRAYRPDGSVSVVAVDPSAAIPSEDTRRVMLEVTRVTNPETVAVAVMILGDGFWASALRGVLTTLGFLGQPTHPRKVFRYEEEGVEWAIESIGESRQKYRTLLLDALAQLRPAESSPEPPTTSKLPPATSKLPPSSKRRTG